MSEENKQTSTEATPQEGVNPQEETQKPEKTGENPTTTAEGEVDYQKKFSESSKEALRLLEENKEKARLLAEKEAEIERLKNSPGQGPSYGNDPEPLYPGFELLSEDERKNLLAYTEGIKKKALEELYKQPEIVFAKKSFNEQKWNSAFDKVASEFPDIRESKEFKDKYFNPDNVPSNIEEILRDLAKVYLFDKARDLGAKQAIEQQERIDIERAKGGEKTPSKTTSRTLDEWATMARTNPKKFASLSAEYNADLASGKLK